MVALWKHGGNVFPPGDKNMMYLEGCCLMVILPILHLLHHHHPTDTSGRVMAT